MKKNLFEISTDEVQRILSLHESRSKSHYLNIVEQSGPAQYITSKRNCFDNSRCVPEKTKFVPLNKKVAIAYGVNLNKQESPVNIKFYCKANGGQFGISYKNGEMTVKNELLKNTLLKTVCGRDANMSNDVKSFNQTANDNIRKSNAEKLKTVNVNQPAKKTTLTDEQKLDRALLCGHGSWEEYKNSKWACAKQLDAVNVGPKKVTNQTVTGVGGQTNRQQQSTNNTINYTKQIQQSLGSTNATGKITDTDIDSILTKLGGNTTL